MKARQQHAGIIILVVMAAAASIVLAGGDTTDIDKHRSCGFCGMDRKAYGYSRMLIRYEDGADVGTCSLHCAVTEFDSNKDRAVKELLVADRDNRMLIPAESALWVMGGSKRGVMTQRPKWAFRSKAAAEAFIAEYGGKIATWADTLAAAREDLSRELK